MEQTKCCTKCGIEKSRAEFHADKSKADGLNKWCKVCRLALCAAYRKSNPEKWRESVSKYREANREKCRKSNANYRATNLEKTREASRQSARRYFHANAEKCRLRNREWRRENPDKNMARYSRRRARKLAATDPTANQDAIEALYAEAKMAEAFTGTPMAVDHAVPLARSGRHHEDNLRVLPAHLNSVKGAKLDSEVTDPAFKAWLSNEPTFGQVTWRSFHKGSAAQRRSSHHSRGSDAWNAVGAPV
jgi:hypothetical protein